MYFFVQKNSNDCQAEYSSNNHKNINVKNDAYIEKKVLGLFWSRVDIGTTDDQWVDTIYDYRYTGSRTYQLPSSGTYRVTVNFKIYGNGGAADNIENQQTVSY